MYSMDSLICCTAVWRSAFLAANVISGKSPHVPDTELEIFWGFVKNEFFGPNPSLATNLFTCLPKVFFTLVNLFKSASSQSQRSHRHGQVSPGQPPSRPRQCLSQRRSSSLMSLSSSSFTASSARRAFFGAGGEVVRTTSAAAPRGFTSFRFNGVSPYCLCVGPRTSLLSERALELSGHLRRDDCDLLSPSDTSVEELSSASDSHPESVLHVEV